ncbi:CDC14 phosphatase [Cryptosporidium xiaoi]|uniref:protein-tyrosine-phosphatase n=1 Tax=Cryptosporidium xiaoi TaxID=659607 RepID=A0AAV9XY68_9CRYT
MHSRKKISNIVQGSPITLIENKFYWSLCVSNLPCSQYEKKGGNIIYFCIDDELVYEPFFQDFGPLNLRCIYKYCKKVDSLLKTIQGTGGYIMQCTNAYDMKKRTNSAFLACCYLMIRQGKTPGGSLTLFNSISLLSFRDATYGTCSYSLSVGDCLLGLYYAMILKWFQYDEFDVEEYSKYEKIENGDISWIVPNKFIAFSGPSGTSIDEDGYLSLTPEFYVPIFKKLGVSMVIRLNKKQYDSDIFRNSGIKHEELYFIDGSCPPREILNRFLELTEKQNGVIAVHCKAGLGRTGTLLGCYAIKNYHFTAAAWIGWNRIARPGSVLGPQQQFLHEIEANLFARGSILAPEMRLDSKIPLISKKVQEAIQKQSKIRQIQSINLQTTALVKNPQISNYSTINSATLRHNYHHNYHHHINNNDDDRDGSSPTKSTVNPFDISPLEQEVIQMMSNLSAVDNIALIGDAGQGERLVQAKKNILR